MRHVLLWCESICCVLLSTTVDISVSMAIPCVLVFCVIRSINFGLRLHATQNLICLCNVCCFLSFCSLLSFFLLLFFLSPSSSLPFSYLFLLSLFFLCPLFLFPVLLLLFFPLFFLVSLVCCFLPFGAYRRLGYALPGCALFLIASYTSQSPTGSFFGLRFDS